MVPAKIQLLFSRVWKISRSFQLSNLSIKRLNSIYGPQKAVIPLMEQMALNFHHIYWIKNQNLMFS